MAGAAKGDRPPDGGARASGEASSSGNGAEQVAVWAARQLLRAERPEEVVDTVQRAVAQLGGTVVPADCADEAALPVDVALGRGVPAVPTAAPGSPARLRLERALPGVVADARLALDALARAEQLARDASVDSLTGLGNRGTFDRLLTRLSSSDVVVAIDLDRFKWANDTYGHPAGDEVLRVFADCLRRQLRAGDVAMRLGGDEFALVLRDSDRAGAEAMLKRLRAEWSRARPVEVGFSAGVAAGFTGAGSHAAADRALYEAKAAGGDTTRFDERGAGE